MRTLLTLFTLLATIHLTGQIPRAEVPEKAVILYNGTAHIGNGEVMEHCALGIENGQIIFVADARTIRIDTSRARVIDVTGQHIYPGLIAPNTLLGLLEIHAVRATRDFAEAGEMNPNVRGLIAYNTDSRILPTMTANGILTAQIVPESGRISGLSSVVSLDAWNWEDAAIAPDNGMHLHWPERRRFKEDEQDKWAAEMQQVHRFFDEAQAYATIQSHEVVNQKLEAMRGLFDRTRTLFVHVQGAEAMLQVLRFVREYDLKAVLVGARDVWMITDEVRESGIPVILHPIHSLPPYRDQDYDQPYKTPAMLAKDSILFCLSGYETWKQRTLAQQAGTAASFGLDKEMALQSVTLSAARILGVDDRLGSLEAGKQATLFVAEGDVLDVKSSRVLHAFIDGRIVNLDNHQHQLYELYRKHYGLD